tara:strand:- start:332 stop:511 length:180 start_codon:yes stop_codon:yes gene_type:complete
LKYQATAYGTALGSFVILAVAAAGVTFIPIVVAVLYFAYQKGVTQVFNIDKSEKVAVVQ